MILIGGALSVRAMTSVIINSTNFLSNTAPQTGGVAISTFNAQLSYSDFLENTATGTVLGGGGISILNLGIPKSHSPPTPTLQHPHTQRAQLTFVFLGGGDSTAISISYCNFVANTAHVGGGVYIPVNVSSTEITINRCSFKNNNASTNGAGLLIDGGILSSSQSLSVTVSYSAFQGNNAGTYGGALMVQGPRNLQTSVALGLQTLLIYQNNAGIGGAGMFINNVQLSLDACVVTKNSLGTITDFYGASTYYYLLSLNRRYYT